jgi:signal transduction histidine kinase
MTEQLGEAKSAQHVHNMDDHDEDGGDGTPSAEQFLRGEFLERLAHEMRGPTGVTLGALDELELALGPDAERLRALLNMARRGARKVLRTADRLSRTAQLDASHLELSPVPADLAALVRTACSDAETVEGRRTVKVTLQVADGPCLARLDAGWAQAAVVEVVTQGLRSARRAVDVSLSRDGDHCIVTVSDDGPARALVTERFVSQADRRDTGLAMPLAADVMRAHGGDLRSEQGSNGRVNHVMIFLAG